MFIPIWVILCFFLIVIYMMHQRGKEIDRLNNTIFNKKANSQNKNVGFLKKLLI